MNFLLDATLGMLVIWAAVKLVSKLVEYKQWSLLVFGEYGECASLIRHTGAPQTHWRSDETSSRSSSCTLGRDSQFIPHQFCWDIFDCIPSLFLSKSKRFSLK